MPAHMERELSSGRMLRTRSYMRELAIPDPRERLKAQRAAEEKELQRSETVHRQELGANAVSASAEIETLPQT